MISAKMLPLSIILVLGMLLQGVSAFIITHPTRDTRSATDYYCNTNHRCKISKHQQQYSIFRDSNTQLHAEIDNCDNLEDVLKATNKGTKKSKSKSTSLRKKTNNKQPIEISKKSLSKSQSKVNGKEEEEENDDYKEYNIPKTGYSLSDQLETKSPENKERFETTLTPIVTGVISSNSDDNEKKIQFDYDDDGFPIGYKEIKEDADDNDDEKNSARHQGVARIDTISTLGNAGEEPVRWLVSLDDTNKDSEDKQESFALIDLPPYSDRLVNDIRSFMDPEYNNNTTVSTSSSSEDTTSSKANLDVILLTNQQCIHYDTSPGVYVKRKSELTKWKKAFPTAQVVMYRLDIPRECREEVTQVLDGYGPWGWEEVGEGKDSGGVEIKNKFVETGRPLTIEEWDDDTKTKVLTQGELPPDDQVDNQENSSGDDTNSTEEDELYSSEAIRKREEKYRLLAVYTPGSTFGSVTYILPQRGICCSGHALPIESSGNTAIEENYDEEDDFVSSSSPVPPQGPRLDYQGYLASSASRPRQMSSASVLISSYIDRFRVVLPARGDIVFLDSDENTRKRELMESVGLYQKVSDIYNRLGIVE